MRRNERMTACLIAVLTACAGGPDDAEDAPSAADAPALAQKVGFALKGVSTDEFHCTGNRISLRTLSGYYLSAEGGGGGPVSANREAAGPWENFTFTNLGGGKIALRAANGNYFAAQDGGGAGLEANRSSVGPWETFVLWAVGYRRADSDVYLPAFALSTSQSPQRFVSAENGGGAGLTVDRTKADIWETFRVICR